MTTAPTSRQGLLRRLLRNRAGNTIVLTGAAMLPMAALAGSAVDMSRLYLVRARLQQACDAGALAGRRFMTDRTFDANAQAQANSYFNFNFPAGAYGVTSRSFTPSRTAGNQVAGVATATLPMVVMHMFGMTPRTLSVECEAKFEVANTDVVFVLDTTGSMACDQADDTATCTAYATQSANTVQIDGRWQTRQRPNSRLRALRAAIKDFHDVLDGAVSSDARLRFGFVPYSSSVNVGRAVMNVDPSFISDTAVYQSRRRIEDGTYRTTGPSYSGWSRVSTDAYGSLNEIGRASRTQSDCNAQVPTPNPTRISSEAEQQQGQPQITMQNDTQVTVVRYRRSAVEGEVQVTWGVGRESGTSRTCVVRRRNRNLTEERTATSTRTPNYEWRYEPITSDTSRFKQGEPVTTRTGDVADNTAREGSNVTATWSGCIQERDTVAAAEVDVGDNGAFDLDIDALPFDAATRWRPSWPQIIYNRGTRSSPIDSPNTVTPPSTENTRFSCPKAAESLREMERTDIDTYVDAADFIPHGGTYHDIGLLWGARLISPDGIFSGNHSTPANGGTVQRHIIFMTDGDMSPSASSYSTYGTEVMEGRIGTNDTTELKARHNYRFESICRAIRDRNVTLWVVAYGQEMTTQLSNCATPGLAFAATNAAQLQAQFRQIAAQIAELRLER